MQHDFTSRIEWTGNRGEGTATYRGYDRTWDIATPGKPVIVCSNDPLLGGDPALPNPEDLLLASLAGCHMLWYLHLASAAGIVVTGYTDDPLGVGESEPDGTGRFVRALLRPRIELAAGSAWRWRMRSMGASTRIASSRGRSLFRWRWRRPTSRFEAGRRKRKVTQKSHHRRYASRRDFGHH